MEQLEYREEFWDSLENWLVKDGSKWEWEDPSHWANRQTDLGIPQGGVLSVNLFPVAMNSILGELGNRVDWSLFADDMAT